ncbi:MAG TPA: hypothetical protein VF599_11925 [Pyrinomonadaceae bacterium]
MKNRQTHADRAEILGRLPAVRADRAATVGLLGKMSASLNQLLWDNLADF